MRFLPTAEDAARFDQLVHTLMLKVQDGPRKVTPKLEAALAKLDRAREDMWAVIDIKGSAKSLSLEMVRVRDLAVAVHPEAGVLQVGEEKPGPAEPLPEPSPTEPIPVRGPVRLMRSRDVTGQLGISRAQLYVLINRGDLPKPVRVGARGARWRSDAIDGYIATRTAP